MLEQYVWHALATIIFSLSLWHLRKGMRDSRSWFCVFFAIAYSGNILGYPLAILGDPIFEWIKHDPAAVQHARLLIAAMIASWMGHLLVRRKLATGGLLKNLPELTLSEVKLDRIFRLLAFSGAFLSITLSMLGYYGYYIEREYLATPPAGLAVGKMIITICFGLLFIVMIKRFQRNRYLGIQISGLLFLWIIAGIVSGFKTMVVAPGLFVLIASWMGGRVRKTHFLFMGLLLITAYNIVEPMRVAKIENESLTVYEGLTHEVWDKGFVLMSASEISKSFLQRIDYTRNAVRTLNAYQNHQLGEFERRVDEYYRLAPVIAFVPRAIWPSKPLANLGGVLSEGLTGNARNAITPSQIVMTYIAGGWAGLIVVSALWGMLCTMGGQIMVESRTTIYRRAPFILLAFAISNNPSIMAAYFISSLRLAFVIYVLYILGLLRKFRSPNVLTREGRKRC